MPPTQGGASSQRRSYERKSKAIRCNLHLTELVYVGQTLDISPGGVQLVIDTWDAADRFPLESTFEIGLKSIWGESHIVCKVVRLCSDSPYTVGIEFDQLNDEERQTLQTWLYG